MKRLVLCFDGTWQALDSPNSTNVVITAESVTPIAADGVAQFIFYDDGVGTGKRERFRGGVFGEGLIKNLADGYRFIIFNYSPGDEIYIFGFSRGAFTARSFAGLLKACGILLRENAAKVSEAIDLYKQRNVTSPSYQERMMRFRSANSPHVCVSDEEDAWRRRNVPGYGDAPAHRLYIHYVGVWDTVGSLGVPVRYTWFSWINKKNQFHDAALSDFVKSGRHAVAIDERRKDFAPSLWDNVDQLNAAAAKASEDADAPYQQVWFPGVHTGVGGGGDWRGLSDQALDWLVDGARLAGLVLDPGDYSRIFELAPNYRDHLQPFERPGFFYKLLNALFAADRTPGPQVLHEVSISARRRWLAKPGDLRDGRQYRPKTLAGIAALLNSLNPDEYGVGPEDADPIQTAYTMYIVKRGDQLRMLAKEFYGDPNESDRILRANRDKIDDPNRIYPGQLLRIPRKPQ
jgi:uncharacterized protein (DUF2235 family)